MRAVDSHCTNGGSARRRRVRALLGALGLSLAPLAMGAPFSGKIADEPAPTGQAAAPLADPTQPPGWAATGMGASTDDPALSSTILGGPRPLAIIDGRLYAPGDRIGERVVQAIGPGWVILAGDKDPLRLRIPAAALLPSTEKPRKTPCFNPRSSPWTGRLPEG